LCVAVVGYLAINMLSVGKRVEHIKEKQDEIPKDSRFVVYF